MKTIIIVILLGILLGLTLKFFFQELVRDLDRDVRILNIGPKSPSKPPSKPVAPQTGSLWRVTAYCPCEKCCGRFADGITASGAPAIGRIIAAPSEIPFGTELFIEGYGYGKVQDRGGSIKGKRLDVLFPTHNQALEWGVKMLEVEIPTGKK